MRRPEVPVGRRPAGHAAPRPPRFRLGLPKLPLSLSNWLVSWRLSAVIVVAVVPGMVFGGLRTTDAIETAAVFARTTQLAFLGEEATTLAQAMENERDLTAAMCAASPGGRCPTAGERVNRTAQSLQADIRRAQAATNVAAGRVQTLAARIGSPFPSGTQAKAAGVVAMIGSLGSLRTRGVTQPPQAVIVAYTEAIASLFALNDEIASASGDPVLSDEVRTLGSLSRAKDDASQERAILDVALIDDSFDDVPAELATAQGLEDTDLAAFATSATHAVENDYLTTVEAERTDTGQLLANFLFLAAVSDPKLSPASAFALAFSNAQFTRKTVIELPSPDLCYSTMTETITRMRIVEQRLATAIFDRSQSLERGARESAALTAAVTGVLLLVVLCLTWIVARSLVHPLRRLQADALKIAAVQLPARVAALGQAMDPDAALEVEPVSVHSTDEIGQVARAFDRVHSEAVRLAGNEALLRGSLSAMFISLSRRSVPLIERLARLIDSLEQEEGDPGRLSSLFSMDHLVTRMRRHSENLLLLAGEEPARKWSEPVPLSDVARAAISEIAQYTRVVLDIQPEGMIPGHAASDIVHLLAEIIENATIFSPPDAPVDVSSWELSGGGVLIEVRDNGVGASVARLAEMNHRLDTPPEIDVSVSRHMGLFAVSRLAARHGIQVRLRPVSPRGLAAQVWLPSTLTGTAAARATGRWAPRSASPTMAAAPVAPSDWFQAKRPSGVRGRPLRRSPQQARDRLRGFQLGSRDQAEDWKPGEGKES
jgi:signal transduction histidine kinase